MLSTVNELTIKFQKNEGQIKILKTLRDENKSIFTVTEIRFAPKLSTAASEARRQ